MTVISRRIKASPVRTATETWAVIIGLLAPDKTSGAREELEGIAGVASSLIADETMKSAPCVVYGPGPRIRIYCLHDEDAITGEDANETAFTSSPTTGH